MNVFRILLAEVRYRKLNFALSLLAVMIAVALFVAGPILVDGYGRQTQVELQGLEQRVGESAARVAQAQAAAAEELTRLEDETRVVMRDLGFNLMLLHRDTDLFQFHSTRVPAIELPEEFVQRLAANKRLDLVTHLVATLRGKTDWQGHDVLLVGWLPEVPQPHMKHESPMGFRIEPGAVLLGYHLGQGKQVGDTLQLGGQQFRVAQILPEQGTEEDIAINLHLHDAQTVLQKPGKINVIMALECRCPIDALPAIQQQLRRVSADLIAVRDKSKADGRAAMRASVAKKHQQIIESHKAVLEERKEALAATVARREKVKGLMETLAGVITPLVVLATAIWVGLLALANVRERRTEIGLLRALGKGSATIAVLFLGKAVLVGVLGAAVGVLLGTLTAQFLGARLLEVTGDHFALHYPLLLIALLGAPALSALAGYLPTLSALLQDPAVVLREQ